MPEVRYDISVEVWCSTCGTGLCGSAKAEDNRGVVIEACDKCLKAEYERGYADGLEEGEKNLDF